MPAPGAVAGSTLRYALLNALPVAALMPSRLDSALFGFIAIRLPPPLTQVVSVLACAAVTATLPSTTTSYAASVDAESVPTSMVANSLSPSVRRISARYLE